MRGQTDIPSSAEGRSEPADKAAPGDAPQGRASPDRASPDRASLAERAAAVSNAPDDAGAWNALAIGFFDENQIEAALAAFRRALELAPRTAVLHTNCGNALRVLGRLEEAEPAVRRAAELGPKIPLVWQNLATVLLEMGRVDEAIEAYGRALAVDPAYRSALWDRSNALLRAGRFREGWRDYGSRWHLNKRPTAGKPAWDGKAFQGRRLLLLSEQGLGDSLLAWRFLPAVKALGGTVILQCRDPLLRLARRLPFVDAVVRRDGPQPEADLESRLLDLPNLLGLTLETLPTRPYLPAPEASERERFKALFATAGRRVKVGIAWSGSVTFGANAQRSLTPEHFLGLLDIPGVSLYSLQIGPRAADLQKPGYDRLITDLSPMIQDMRDTAAALAELDLVITVDTSLAHLTGALGRPLWVLLHHLPYWIWMDGPATPWYPNARLYRQRRPGAWDQVFAEVRRDLRAAVSARRRPGAG